MDLTASKRTKPNTQIIRDPEVAGHMTHTYIRIINTSTLSNVTTQITHIKGVKAQIRERTQLNTK